MSNTAKISVVVPLYNKSETILRCLDSIIRQSFSDWECIVINDGSKDDGPAKVSSLSDPRIQLHSQPNAGPGVARNNGVRLAKAPLVAFLDADDEWDENYLEYHFGILSTNDNVAASVCNHRRIGTDTDTDELFGDQVVPDGIWQLPASAPPESLKVATDFMHSGCVVMKKEVFWKYGGYYDRNRCTYGEDTHLWIQVVASEILWRTPKAMMSYHVEDSCLGLGRKTTPPPWPMLLQPQVLLDGCRAETRQALEQALGFYAMVAANRLLIEGRFREAQCILNGNAAYTRLTTSRCVRERRKLRKLIILQPYITLKNTLGRLTGGDARRS